MTPFSFFADENSIDIEELIATDLQELVNNHSSHHNLLTPPSPQSSEILLLEDVSDSDSNSQSLQARQASIHFNKMVDKCLGAPKCDTVDTHLQLAKTFATTAADQKHNMVKAMLLCLSAPPSQANALIDTKQSLAQTRRNKRQRLSQRSYTSTRYTLRGKRVCQFGFAALVQLNPRTVRTFAATVSGEGGFKIFINEHHKGRKGKQSLQTVAALAFLRRYAALYALSCPTGRGSQDETPVQWLSSDVRREAVYDLYKAEWEGVMNAAAALLPQSSKPEELLSFSGFRKALTAHYPSNTENI